MNHLIISREYPPRYQSGGIGTYVEHISRLLAESGETVHVIAQRWPAAPKPLDVQMDGRLVIHRVSLDEPLPHAADDAGVLSDLRRSPVPVQAFSWQAARLAEWLCSRTAIDVIEAQDYEAPAYHLLRRRRDGSGLPVPVIVHLHTPSEFLFIHNEWDAERPESRLMARLEEYAICAADALLCPSAFLAQVAAVRYRLEPGCLRVVPLPVGDTPVLSRADDIWRTGTIVCVGRLEPRKGVKEWLAAAVQGASQYPDARFAFIGGDWIAPGPEERSMRETLRAAIPEVLRDRFAFVDAVPRAELATYLQRARIAVIPSRFENFPNTCVEAMATGLPVLVSPTGGMAEMVEDGRTGWIAGGQDAQSLAFTLRRALTTPARELAAMGAAAADAIRTQCDNAVTVRRHIDFRRTVAARHAGRPGTTGVCAEPGKLATIALEIDALSRARATRAPRQGPDSMTILDFVRASPRQQAALIRRALADPAYVRVWCAWQLRRAFARLSRRAGPPADRSR